MKKNDFYFPLLFLLSLFAFQGCAELSHTLNYSYNTSSGGPTPTNLRPIMLGKKACLGDESKFKKKFISNYKDYASLFYSKSIIIQKDNQRSVNRNSKINDRTIQNASSKLLYINNGAITDLEINLSSSYFIFVLFVWAYSENSIKIKVEGKYVTVNK